MQLLNHEPIIRLSFFIGILLIMFILELLIPKRPLVTQKKTRWLNNLGLVILDSLILRLIFPTAAVGIAIWAQENHYGLFNLLNTPVYISTILSVVLLDLAIYTQHIIFHKIPLLWRFHKVHHVDQDIDVTTGLRFHPVEIILSLCIKFGIVILLGAPALGVMIFEILLNGIAMFNHSNIHLPPWLDKVLRRLIVTPDMHRVHHSIIHRETDSNYGFNLSIWDQLFKTYIAQPQKGHLKMEIGLKAYKDQNQTQKLWKMLLIPFKTSKLKKRDY
jgi:sterol desaturase/sphingolipid hydroxylase (fatty acid hydroxylase superfamily)